MDREQGQEKTNILVTLVSRRELDPARQEGKASQGKVWLSDRKPSEFWQLWEPAGNADREGWKREYCDSRDAITMQMGHQGGKAPDEGGWGSPSSPAVIKHRSTSPCAVWTPEI
ncbi:hypothetical protein KAM385_21080 [Aeromonas hydrophila]|nr:hypothetical protein KAM385_21080 [Aeromonas hydrophila]